jgi:predicted transcriptional regulator
MLSVIRSKPMAARKKIDDKELALLNARGYSQQQMADELGVSRVAIGKRLTKLRAESPWMLELTTVEKFRDNESDMVAGVRQMLLEALRNKTHKNLQQMSVNQLATAYAILWDKDEKIQDRKMIKQKVVDSLELTDEQKQLIGKLIESRTRAAIEEAAPEITSSGDSEQETLEAEYDVVEIEPGTAK